MRLIDKGDGTVLIRDFSNIPVYDKSYIWVSDFLKCEELEEKISALNEQRKQIQLIPLANSEKLKRLKIGYDNFQARVAEVIKNYLRDPNLWHAGSQDPFVNFEFRFPQSSLGNFFIPPLSFFEEAIKDQTDDGITDQDRAKKLGDIDSKIAKLQAEIPITITSEHRKFVAYWRELQEQLSEPAGPTALSLDASPDAEKSAWRRLGLVAYINPKGLKPNPLD